MNHKAAILQLQALGKSLSPPELVSICRMETVSAPELLGLCY